MTQQLIAILIILFFIIRISVLKKRGDISAPEYLIWLTFWFFSLIVILFIKKIDVVVSNLGFSSSGIDVLLYLAIVVLFYLMFRVRLQLEKTEKEISKIVKEIGIKRVNNEK